MNLCKHIRTHSILLKDGRILNITKAQYEFYREQVEMKKYTDFISIEDIDTKKIIFEGRCSDILEFKARDIGNNEDIITICGYGKRHKVVDGDYQCDCLKNYGYFDFDLMNYVGKKYELSDCSKITSEMRKEFYLINNQKK